MKLVFHKIRVISLVLALAIWELSYHYIAITETEGCIIIIVITWFIVINSALITELTERNTVV